MKKQYFLIGVLVLIMGLPIAAEAQRNKREARAKSKQISRYRGGKAINFSKASSYTSVSFNINAMNYFGDLAPINRAASTDISFTRPGFGAYVSHKMFSRVHFRAGFNWGRIRADDISADPADPESVGRYIRNLHFRNDIKELSLMGQVDLFPNEGGFLTRVDFTPYVFGGIAVFHHNPKAVVPETDLNGNPFENAGEWVALRPLGTEGQFSEHYDVRPYSRIQIAIPLGIGATYKLTDNINISAEIGYRHLFTDYLDDVSGLYVDLGGLDSELARAMSYRSEEAVTAVGGVPRDFEVHSSTTGRYTYTSRYNGEEYTVWGGFGDERYFDTDPRNPRGNPGDVDIYLMTTLKIVYILKPAISRGKFR